MLEIINKLRMIIPPKYKWLALLLILIMGVSAILELCALGMLMPIVMTLTDTSSLHGDGYINKLYHFFGVQNENAFLTYVCIFFLLFYTLKTAFNYFSIWCQSYYGAKMTTLLTQRLITKYVRAPYGFHVNLGASELITRVQNVRRLLTEVFQSLFLVLSESIVVLALITTFLLIMPKIAAIIIPLGAISFLIYLPIKKRVQKLGKSTYEWNQKYNKTMFQAFGTIKEVKLFSSENFFIDTITNSRWELCKTEKRIWDMSQLPRLMVELFAVIIAMTIIIILINIDTSTTNIIMYCAVLIAAMFRIMPSLTRIQYNSVYIRGGIYLLQMLHRDLTSTAEEQISKTGKNIKLQNAIKFEDVSFSYQPDVKPIFDKFNNTIKRNECIALVGPSGSGKTTLINLLMGFYQPNSGRIKVDDTDINDNLKSWRHNIGYVSQEVCLFNDTIRKNIAFCKDEEIDDEKVCESLKLAQIYDFVQTLPEKENTVIGEMGTKLSGGQRQRLAIARAIYHDPHLLILDEATSALDNDTEKAFVDALNNLKGSLTIIMIAHRLSSIEHCDRTITIGN